MNCWPLNLTRVLTLLAVSLLAGAGSHANEIAVATYTDIQVSPGVFQYDFTLTDTGTTKIGTFWLAWIPGNGFLSAMPTGIVNPAGWNSFVTDHFAILFIAVAPTAPISPTDQVTFQFNSTETPAQLMGTFGGPAPGIGDAVTTYFVYSGVPFSDDGFHGVATPATVATPEPRTNTPLVLAMGILGLSVCLVKKRRSMPAV
jgi:hypothetical protein